jgi:4-hydroxy-4-methyl-2-oxoglutarate aldolase
LKTVRNDLRRPDPELVAAYREILAEYSPSCLVTDAQARGGAIGGLATVTPQHKIVGPALTVDLDIDDLVDCMPVLALAEPGDVIVVACWETTRTAMWGALMSTLSMKAGIAAGIVDGAVRDVDEIRDLDFPLWYRSTVPRASPTSVHGHTEPVRVNVPVVVGGQVIAPGDLLVADENGVAVVPSAAAAEVLVGVRRQMDKERVVREKINSGASVVDLLREFGHL